MATKKIKCGQCGREGSGEKYFYMSKSALYKHNDSRVHICKDCTIDRYEKLVEKYNNELKALYHLCMNLDIYYGNDLAMSLYSNLKEKDNLARLYLSKVNSLQQYKGLTGINSDSIILNDGLAVEVYEAQRKKVSDEESFEITPDVLKRWGKGMKEEDYFFLESTYDEFTTVYDDKTPAQKLIFRQIAKALLEGEKAIKDGNTSGFEKMNNLVSKLMNDGNIKPIQEASIAEDDSQGWGVWVNKIETERPIGEACEQFKDVDGIGKYITKWFTKQMQRVFDLSDNSEGDNDVDQD